MSETTDINRHDWSTPSAGVVDRCRKCGITPLSRDSEKECPCPPVPSAPEAAAADVPPDYISNLMRKVKAAGQESKAASLKYDTLLRAVIVALKAHGLSWIVRPDVLEELKND